MGIAIKFLPEKKMTLPGPVMQVFQRLSEAEKRDPGNEHNDDNDNDNVYSAHKYIYLIRRFVV